ncbi:MAG: glycine cleavage system protein GcvH [Parachlamydiales bacterium]
MRRYTESHEWVEKQGKTCRVGISRYAQQELGEIVHIELPKVGAKVSAEQEAAILESTKAASDVYSPLSGTITAVNDRVKEDPRLLNTSPEEEGWLFSLEPTSEAEWETLLTEEGYHQMVGAHS